MSEVGNVIKVPTMSEQLSNMWTMPLMALPNTRTISKYSGDLPIQTSNIYIKKIIYNNPATIVFWSDNTKTVARCCADDVFSEEVGLMSCVLKKMYGGKRFRQLLSDWVPEQTSVIRSEVTLRDVRKKHKEDKKGGTVYDNN